MNKISEPNVQSPNTEDDKSGITIEPMPTPYKAFVEFSYKELREAFDDYWTKVGDVIIRNTGYKGRKLKGGKNDMSKAQATLEKSHGVSKLYKGKLMEVMGELIEAESEKKVMIMTDAALYNFEPENENIVGVGLYYYWPKLTRDKDTLNFDIVDPYSGITAEKSFEEHHVPQLVEKHKAFTASEDTVIGTTHRVSLDVITSNEEGPVDQLTWRSQWKEVRDLPTGLVEHVIGRDVGDLFEVDWQAGEEKFHSHVKVYAIMDTFRPDPTSSELFEKEGFESKEACFAKFKEDFDKRFAQAHSDLAFDDIMTKVVTEAQLDSVPQVWIDMHRKNFTDRHIEQCNGDKHRACQAIGAVDEKDMLAKFEAQVYQQTINQMAINWYAEAFNCLPDNTSISKDLETRVNWVEPPPPPEHVPADTE